GAFGYWLCRLSGEKLAIKLLGDKDYERGKKLFANNVGGLMVVFSRWLPIFPEVMACMAGLTRMPARDFHVALACGSLPLGFVFAFVGYTGKENPVLAIALSAIVPVIIYLLVRPIFKKRLAE
ncbi:MAG TPA: VTT domain-containing protein, partial [Cyclobacteriaceae bacterium]|nr:VTT domain-containing protein [Cyclobacteriaceae bacterium]